MMASTLQLEFAQAMSDFKTMFPDMECGVIEAVLRANQGAVDATIDQLLAMSTDNQNEKLRNELEQNASNPSPPIDSILDSILPVNSAAGRSTGASPKVKIASPAHSSTHKKWDPPLLCPLPATFLRLTNEVSLGRLKLFTPLNAEILFDCFPTP